MVTGMCIRPKRLWLASNGSIRASAHITSVVEISREQFEDFKEDHQQEQPPETKKLYCLTFADVKVNHEEDAYYLMPPPTLFHRYRKRARDLPPVSATHRKQRHYVLEDAPQQGCPQRPAEGQLLRAIKDQPMDPTPRAACQKNNK